MDTCFACDDDPTTSGGCKRHTIMLSEIAKHGKIEFNMKVKESSSDETKAVCKQLKTIINVLNLLDEDGRVKFLLKQLVVHKLCVRVFEGIYTFVAMHYDLDGSMENTEKMMEDGQITEGEYLHACDTLKILHEAQTRFKNSTVTRL